MELKFGVFLNFIIKNEYISNFVKKKKLLGVKRVTQNDFVYGELGRVSLQVTIHLSIIKYWLKILECENVKYIRYVYDFMLSE